MENKLNFRRLTLILKSYWIEGKILLLMTIGATIGIILFLYYVNTYQLNISKLNKILIELNSSIQQIVFICGINGFGIILVSYIFKNYSEKNAATGGLLLPATYYEKLAAGILICLVLFPIIFCFIFFSVDYAYVSYLNLRLKAMNINNLSLNGIKQNVPYFFQLIEKPEIFLKPLIGGWLCVQSFTIIGIIHFQKQAKLKTVALGGLLVLGFIFINIGLHKLLVESLFEPMPINIRIGGEEIQKVTATYSKVFRNIIFYLLPPILIITAYFKLKEKQV